MTAPVVVPELLTSESLVALDTGLESFLADPIGYGVFDSDDPITLDEFSTTRHHRSLYVAPLAF